MKLAYFLSTKMGNNQPHWPLMFLLAEHLVFFLSRVMHVIGVSSQYLQIRKNFANDVLFNQ